MRQTGPTTPGTGWAAKGWAVSNIGSGGQPQETADRLHREVAELRRSRRRLAEAALADRREIERDLHDGIQQHLVALAVNLQRLAGLVDGEPAAAKALIHDLAVNVGEALDESTELAQKVYPSLLEGPGLASAIRSAADRVGITVVVEVQATTAHPPEITAAVYWCCLEALASASPGSNALVTVRDVDGTLTFDIAIAGRLGNGRLERLRDRIEAFDGHVAVEHPKDGGSLVHGWLSASR